MFMCLKLVGVGVLGFFFVNAVKDVYGQTSLIRSPLNSSDYVVIAGTRTYNVLSLTALRGRNGRHKQSDFDWLLPVVFQCLIG